MLEFWLWTIKSYKSYRKGWNVGAVWLLCPVRTRSYGGTYRFHKTQTNCERYTHQNRFVVRECDACPIDSFFLIFFLFPHENMLQGENNSKISIRGKTIIRHITSHHMEEAANQIAKNRLHIWLSSYLPDWRRTGVVHWLSWCKPAQSC